MEEIIRWVKAKVSNVLTRAIVLAISEGIKPNTGGGQMFVQVEGLPDDKHSDIELRQQYGFRSKPPIAVRGILLAYGGDKSNLTYILADSKEIENDLDWAEGESRQFNDKGTRHRIFDRKHVLQGDDYLFEIDNDNKIEFVAGSLKFTVGGEVYTFTSSKFQTTTADVKAKTISLLNHLHGGSASAPDGAVSNTQTPVP